MKLLCMTFLGVGTDKLGHCSCQDLKFQLSDGRCLSVLMSSFDDGKGETSREGVILGLVMKKHSFSNV